MLALGDIVLDEDGLKLRVGLGVKEELGLIEALGDTDEDTLELGLADTDGV